MNWVGGSRSRMVLKQERQKQRYLSRDTTTPAAIGVIPVYQEFFQKKKMKSKLKLLESSYPTQASLSLDLLNLHVINQISKKKESSKDPQHLDMCERRQPLSNLRKNVQLPMSPITIPSKLCLDDSEIISVQAKSLECRTDQNSQGYIAKQEQMFEENVNMTSEAKSKDDIHSEFNVNKIGQELEQEFQHCLYDKRTSSNNGIIVAKNITLDNKVKLPLQCSSSHLTTLSLFEMQDNLSLSVSKVNHGKRDVSVQCNFEQEHKFIGCFHNTEAVNKQTMLQL